MLHDHEIIKIAVVESSTILRLGVMSTLGRTLDCGVEYLEVGTPHDFGKVPDFGPDIIIINPSLVGCYNLKHVRQRLGDKALYVALITSPVDSAALDGYSGTIGLYDNPDDVHAMIDRLMGYEEGEENSGLSEREKDIIKGVVRGLPNKSIADELNLSVHTIITHRRNIAKKLQIHSASALTIYAISNKLVDINEVSKNI